MVMMKKTNTETVEGSFNINGITPANDEGIDEYMVLEL